jgi:hypothetical protein
MKVTIDIPVQLSDIPALEMHGGFPLGSGKKLVMLTARIGGQVFKNFGWVTQDDLDKHRADLAKLEEGLAAYIGSRDRGGW